MSDEIMTEEDHSHLNILGIFYFVSGGLGLLFGGGFLLMFGAIMFPVLATTSGGSNGAPEAMVGFVAVIMGVSFLVVIVTSIAMIYAGHCLRTAQHRIFCFIVACLTCTNVPLGTVLGVFTIIVLCRPQVRDAFDQPPW